MRRKYILNSLFFLFFSFPYVILGQTIEEGKGIGELTLGIKESKVIEILGSNYNRRNQKENYEIEFSDKHLIIGFDSDSIVDYILIQPGINLKTKKGLKITEGLTLKDVKKIYGTGRKCSYTKNDETMSFCYDWGISFYVNSIYKNGKQLWLWKNFFQLEKEYKKSKVVEISIEESDLKNSDYTFYEYYDGVYIPKDLDDCFNQLDKFWNDSIKTEVSNMSEDEFIGSSHFGIGLWIRNNWRLWGGSRLSKYFNELGITHPDNMSGIVLTAYYRKLKNQDIELRKLIDYYKK
ncbi:DUF6794 domain-containing protein [Draconibacterium sediminis]|uniref:DUF6794 domain-containing protein n=1 Tax=Draconibacterium sediminis TaxID=1544798 RepID=UPI0026F138D6|nr:DUF6794 domain-containing protein [Draconibacterium sediminis]